MQTFPITVIWRHRKENLKKCSLRGLESRPDFKFFQYPIQEELPIFENYILLTVDAPEIDASEKDCGLFVLDATWRYAAAMQAKADSIPGLIRRSLPAHFRTAYPRRQEDCPLPERGLASIEAIYIAYRLLKRPCEGLLDGYYWKNQFLEKNLHEWKNC